MAPDTDPAGGRLFPEADPDSVQEAAWLVRNLLPPAGHPSLEAIVARVRELERTLTEAARERDAAKLAIDAVCVQMDEMIHRCCGPAWAEGDTGLFCESYGCSTLDQLRAALGGGAPRADGGEG